MEPIIVYLRRRLREAGAAAWPEIAAVTGVSQRLPAKIAYGERANPTVETIQPLLDYFAAVDRGEAELPPEAPPPAPAAAAGHVSMEG